MTRYFALFADSSVDTFGTAADDLPECMQVIAVHPHSNSRFRLVEIEDHLAPPDLDGQRVDLYYDKHPGQRRMTVRYGRRATG